MHRRHGNLPIIASHLGGFRRWGEVIETLVGTGVYLDTSYAFGHIGEKHLGEIIGGHRPERILFGSDSPWTDQGIEIAHLERIVSDSAVRRLILRENAKGLLGL